MAPSYSSPLLSELDHDCSIVRYLSWAYLYTHLGPVPHSSSCFYKSAAYFVKGEKVNFFSTTAAGTVTGQKVLPQIYRSLGQSDIQMSSFLNLMRNITM